MKTLDQKTIIRLINRRIDNHNIELSNCGMDKNDVYHFIVDRHDDYDKIDSLINLLRSYSETYIHDLVSVGFSDEYISCDGCGKIICTTPGYYGDLPDYFIDDNGVSCGECVRDNPARYLEYLDNNPKAGNTILDEQILIDNGYTRFNDESYESGLYQYQTDDPKKIYKELKSKYNHIIFSIDNAGQFDVHFSAWTKNDNE